MLSNLVYKLYSQQASLIPNYSILGLSLDQTAVAQNYSILPLDRKQKRVLDDNVAHYRSM